jgi:hypothetical protein
MLRSQMREVFQARDILIEQPITAPLDHALRRQLIDVLPRAAEVNPSVLPDTSTGPLRPAPLPGSAWVDQASSFAVRSSLDPQIPKLSASRADRARIASAEFERADILKDRRRAEAVAVRNLEAFSSYKVRWLQPKVAPGAPV